MYLHTHDHIAGCWNAADVASQQRRSRSVCGVSGQSQCRFLRSHLWCVAKLLTTTTWSPTCHPRFADCFRAASCVPHLYLGIGSFYATTSPEGYVTCELCRSTDYGATWERLAPHAQFIPLGANGSPIQIPPGGSIGAGGVVLAGAFGGCGRRGRPGHCECRRGTAVTRRAVTGSVFRG